MRIRSCSNSASNAGLILAVALAAVPAAAAAQSGSFVPTGPLGKGRQKHTATQLPDGTVLIAGGAAPWASIASAELYDPATGTFRATGGLVAARNRHTATLLPDGKVLLTGGIVAGGVPTASAELYDPTTRTFRAAGSMGAVRSGHTATLLPDGKVLVAGGNYWAGNWWVTLASAELYDPTTGTFAPTGSMSAARGLHTATLLPTGKLLVAGGAYHLGPSYSAGWATISGAELYDPTTRTFAPTGNLIHARNSHTATLLPSGKVLVVGGNPRDGANGAPVAGAELYDAAAGSFAFTGNPLVPREHHTATLLPDGRVLVAGGEALRWDGYIVQVASSELYDPAPGTFSAGANMPKTRASFTATLLSSNGKVLVAGGYTLGYVPGGEALANAELYGDPQACY